MKHRRLFGIALLFPYLLWGVCLLIANLFSPRAVPDIWNFLLVPAMYYAIGVMFWFIPYTLLAIGMWILSKNRSVVFLRKLGLLAPVLLAGLILIEYLIIYIPILISPNSESTGMTGFLLLLVVSSLFFGYLLVGIALAIFKFLESKNLIEEVQLST